MASEPTESSSRGDLQVPVEGRRMTRAQLSSNPQQKSKILLDKCRRSASDRGHDRIQFGPLSFIQLSDKNFETTDQLRAAVFEILRKRLSNRMITGDQLSQEAVAWCLPSSVDDQDIWRLLLEDPLAVSADLVRTLLTLEPSTPNSAKPSPNSTMFYIRTYTIQVGQLKRVLQNMVDDGYGSGDRIPLWLQITDDMDPKSYVTLRYCGQTKNRPWDRHVADIYSTVTTGFLARFFRTVAKWCPDVLSHATVETVVRANADFKQPAKSIDLREQVLIALFGDGTLNVEAGGKDSMNITNEDHVAFLALGTTNLVDSLDRKTDLPPQRIYDGVSSYARAVRQYVNANPSTTGDGRYVFSRETEDIIAQQAIPTVLPDSSAVMVTLGSDIGELQENQATPFFEGSSRAAGAVVDCYNHFALWEQDFGSTLDANLTKKLARKNHLPFVDLFPWFSKEEKDYPAARKLLTQYMAEVQPLIVLCYGELQTFAMTQPIDAFTFQAVTNSRRGKQSVEEDLGVPTISTYDGRPTGSEVVIIPCFHPGYLAHIGILREKAQALLLLTLAIGWHAADLAIALSQNGSHQSRKQMCVKIAKEIKDKLQPTHSFGKIFEATKKEYLIARKAYYQGRVTRSKAPELAKPPTGILPTKSEHIRRGRVAAIGKTTGGGIGGYEVLVQEQKTLGPKSDNVRFSLTWTEGDGKSWTLSPILLPTEAAPSGVDDKRFMFFVPGGIDLRDNAGQSVGTRKPIASGNTKTETLPISSIVLSMSEKNDLHMFLDHWQIVTSVSLDDVWNCDGAAAASSTEAFLPSSFFGASDTKHTLPFANKSLKQDANAAHLSTLRNTLPANPGDILWLIDRFLHEQFPGGGKVDLASGSEHRDSIYHLITTFCSKATYKHHPHIRTFRALASIVEQGAAERSIATNALVFALQILREPFTKTPKTLKLKVNGVNKESKRFVVAIGAKTPKEVIREWEEPEPEYDVQVLGDETDDEGNEDDDFDLDRDQWVPREKRGREDDHDESALDEGSKSSRKLAKTGGNMGGESSGGVQDKSDEEMLFD